MLPSDGRTERAIGGQDGARMENGERGWERGGSGHEGADRDMPQSR
jgi:hypothetical protein